MMRASPVPHLVEGCDVVVSGTNDLVIKNARTTSVVLGLSLDDLRAILAAIDGEKDLETIIADLAEEYDPDDLRRVLTELNGSVIRFEPGLVGGPGPDRAPAGARVLVVARGLLGQTIHATLSGEGVRCEVWPDAPFASCVDERFRSASRTRSLANEPPAPSSAEATPWTVDALVEQFRGFAVVVCALEDVFYRALLDVNRAAFLAGVAVVYATVDHGRVVLGPSCIPGRTPCFECAQRELHLPSAETGRADLAVLELFRTRVIHEAAFHRSALSVCQEVARELSSEIGRLLSTSRKSQLTTSIRAIGASELELLIKELRGHDDCSVCRPERGFDVPAPAESLDLAAARALAFRRPAAGGFVAEYREAADPIRSVGVVGGGTAGYLTALALRKKYPELDVTLIESSEIPIIGVGEATTPDMVDFLHNQLGIDRQEFYRRVQPTWKLGIKFFWGLPGDYSFNYPFGYMHLLESLVYSGDPNHASLESVLMSRERGPLLRSPSGRLTNLLHRITYAYHLDNKRFVLFLKEKAEGRRIRLVDAKITDVIMAGEDEVGALVAADGRRLSFDLYIDCTGFRSRLIEGALGSRFMSYGDTLYTDTAVVANVPHGGHLKPYTLAETMSSGWCWNIPQVEEDHRGYVFCSAFCSVDEAAAEMRAKNPGMGDPWTVRFRSGRHEHFWKGNVVAIGNAYGFVEPLESTALHMVIYEIVEMLNNFPISKHQHGFKSGLNRIVGQRWDSLRWFLGVHYKFNRKFDTPFWKRCREEVDVSGYRDFLDQYAEGAPLHCLPTKKLLEAVIGPDLFGVTGLDVLVLGQRGVPAKLLEPAMSRSAWQHWYDHGIARLVTDALPQRACLQVLHANPELLEP